MSLMKVRALIPDDDISNKKGGGAGVSLSKCILSAWCDIKSYLAIQKSV